MGIKIGDVIKFYYLQSHNNNRTRIGKILYIRDTELHPILRKTNKTIKRSQWLLTVGCCDGVIRQFYHSEIVGISILGQFKRACLWMVGVRYAG